MLTVSIIGAGDLGGAVAETLAERDRINRLLLVDVVGSVAAGKALDVQQMGAVHGFRTRLDGTDDPSRVIGSAVCVVADRYGKSSAEWQGDEGVSMLRGLAPYVGGASLVFAGAWQADLLSSAVRDLKSRIAARSVRHRRPFGRPSSPLSPSRRRVLHERWT